MFTMNTATTAMMVPVVLALATEVIRTERCVRPDVIENAAVVRASVVELRETNEQEVCDKGHTYR